MISGDFLIDAIHFPRQFTPVRGPVATGILLENLQRGLDGLASRVSLVTLGKLAAARPLEVYLVGGSVRELALGRTTQDLDLAVSAQTLELARDLAVALGGTAAMVGTAYAGYHERVRASDGSSGCGSSGGDGGGGGGGGGGSGCGGCGGGD